MIGMTKSLAREVASRGITANCIAPGFITTPMTDVLNEKQTEEIAKMIPPQRFGAPEEIAAASSTWPATRPATSPARRCTSTAAWPWFRAHGKCASDGLALGTTDEIGSVMTRQSRPGRWPRRMEVC